MKTLRRAFTGLETIAAIALIGLVVVIGTKAVKSFGGLFAGDSKPKQQVVALTAKIDAQTAAEKAAADARAAVDANRAAAAQQKQVRLDQAHQYVAGAGMALAKEPNPSLNVQVASILAKNADQAMDPISAEKLAEMAALVDKLTAQNAADRAAGQAKLDQMQGRLDEVRAQEATLQTQSIVLAAQKAAAEGQATTLQGQVKESADKLGSWATDNATLASRIRTFIMWAIIAGILFAAIFWVLPILGQAFPALAPFAKGVGAIFAGGLHVLHEGEKKAIAAIGALEAKAKGEVQAKLEQEVVAHVATKATLVQIATQPATKAA